MALATTRDFIVTIDPALHVVINQVDTNHMIIRSIDFGISGQVADLVNAWFDQAMEDQAIWAPVLNTYLLELFA